MKTTQSCLLVLSVFATSVIVAAQSVAGGVPASTYDSRVTFAPLVLPEPVNAYRSGSGAPGPQYWQNEADYVMHAGLDAEKKVLTNDEVITYSNNSPSTLSSLWIHLEQNEYRKDSRQHTLGTSPGGFGGRGGSAAAGNNAVGAAGGARGGRGAGANAAGGGAPRSRAENYTEGIRF